MFTSAFWKASFEQLAVEDTVRRRASIAFWGADAFNIVEADWGEQALALAGGAAVLSILTSIVSSAVTDCPGHRLTDSEVLS